MNKKYMIPYLMGLVFAVIIVLFRRDTATDMVLEQSLSMVLHDGASNYCPYTDILLSENIRIDPMSYIYAWLAQFLDMHPILIGKWLMPCVVMALFMIGYSLLLSELFGKESTWNAFIIATWLGISCTWCFGGTWDFTDLYVSPWTSKSILIYGVLPFVLFLICKLTKKIFRLGTIQLGEINRKKAIVFGICSLIIMIMGSVQGGCIWFNSEYAIPDNRFKMDYEIMQIREMVEGMEEVRMVAPKEVAIQIRDCDHKVTLVGTPDEMDNSQFYTEALLDERPANIVVCAKGKMTEEQFYGLGYLLYGETDTYVIYQFVSKDLGKYTVTQYASVTNSQSMIYTITDWEGHLIIVDGGWKQDADQVLKIIEDNGGKVDAWIITHPHPDHVGCFNVIYESGLVPIDTIYAIPMNYTMYKNRAQWWDEFEVYEKFRTLTADAENIVYLHEGDTFDFMGLNFEVLHSFDREQLKNVGDVCNNGGLIFRVDAAATSMLFLGDVGRGQSQNVLNAHSDRLKVDYVQMGHHGNGGMSEEVYQVINPEVAFFDAPQRLMEDETRDAPRKRELMESLGAEIYSYQTAPNYVILE